MAKRDVSKQQSGEEKETRRYAMRPPGSTAERISFGEVLRRAKDVRPVPGPYTLEPPDIVPVADSLRPPMYMRPARRIQRVKLGAIVISMVVGGFIGFMPTRPVELAPAGAFVDEEIVAGMLPAQVGRGAEGDRAGSIIEQAEEPPHIVRLAPIEISISLSASQATGEVEHRPAVRERQIAATDTHAGAVAQAPAPRFVPRADAPSFSDGQASAKPADAVLPATPARDDVHGALEAVVGDARACAPQQRGTVVPLTITFAPSGRVTTALVTGRLAGSEEGSCIARTFRRARVAEFSAHRFVVSYPLPL